MRALCIEHLWIGPVFRRVQWLPVSAFVALGNYIDAPPEQVLSHLQERTTEDKEFFGALVLWVHYSMSYTRACSLPY